MSRINSDDPAFPHLRSECQRVNESEMYEGLTLRAYFAGQAMQGICAGYQNRCLFDKNDANGWAEEAVCIADALIEELNR